MKLYTKRGDDGQTDLFCGQRVSKSDPRVETYGTIDELNSALGLAMVPIAADTRLSTLHAIFLQLQNRLFEAGSDLATPINHPKSPTHIPRIGPAQITQTEEWIDQLCQPLPPMKYFVLPGGSEVSARLHLARTICRRTERLLTALFQQQPDIGPHLLIYFNRLSDLFFAAARYANHCQNIPDVPWIPPQ